MRAKRGSNFIFVIILIALLGILGAAYYSLNLYSVRAAVRQKSYEEDFLAAASIRQALVKSVLNGGNETVNGYIHKAQSGLDSFTEAYRAYVKAEEKGEDKDEPDPADYIEELYSNDLQGREGVTTEVANTDGLPTMKIVTLIDYIPDFSSIVYDDSGEGTETGKLAGKIRIGVRVTRYDISEGKSVERGTESLGADLKSGYEDTGDNVPSENGIYVSKFYDLEKTDDGE